MLESVFSREISCLLMILLELMIVTDWEVSDIGYEG